MLVPVTRVARPGRGAPGACIISGIGNLAIKSGSILITRDTAGTLIVIAGCRGWGRSPSGR